MPISPTPPRGTKTSSAPLAVAIRKPFRRSRRACRSDRTEMHVAGGDPYQFATPRADHEAAVLVDRLEGAAHHAAVETDRDVGPQARGTGQPGVPDTGDAAALVP